MNLYILLIGEIIILCFSYIIFRDLLSPTFDISFVFFVATLIIIPFQTRWNIKYNIKAVLLLLSGLGVFFFVESIVFLINQKREKQRELSLEQAILIRVSPFYQVIFVLILLVTILFLWKEVMRIGTAWSYYGMNSYIMKNYRNRVVYGYDSVNFVTSQLMKISTAIGYASAFVLMNNFIVGGKEQLKKNYGLLISIILLFILQLENSTRGSIINFAIYIVVIYYIKTRWLRGWDQKTNYKIIKVIVISLISVIIVFFGSRSFIGRDTTENFFDNAARYYGGSIQLFNLYVENPTARSKYWGTETFTGIYQSLYKIGLVEYRPIIALEVRNLGTYTGNVYTIFRRPLHDFGIFGMFIFIAIIASMFICAYYNIIRSPQKSNLKLIIYAYFYHWIMQAVIDCYSFNFALTSLVTLTMMIIIYYLFTKVKMVWGRYTI